MGNFFYAGNFIEKINSLEGIDRMRPGFYAIALLCSLPVAGQTARPSDGIDNAVALAKRQNLEIEIAQK